MMKRGYEIFDNEGSIIRITDESNVAFVEMAGTAARDCWIVGHRLNRELLLDLREAIDSILQSWLCDKEPSPQELYRRYLMPSSNLCSRCGEQPATHGDDLCGSCSDFYDMELKREPLTFSDAAQLDMGEQRGEA